MKKVLVSFFVMMVVLLAGCEVEETNKEEVETVESEVTEEKAEEIKEEVKEEELEEEKKTSSSAEILAYSSSVGDYAGEISTNLYMLSELMFLTADDPTYLFFDEWRVMVNEVLDNLDRVSILIQQTEAPEILKDSHTYLLLATYELQYVVAHLPVALDTLDVDLINKCSEAMEASNYFMDLASAELDKLDF